MTLAGGEGKNERVFVAFFESIKYVGHLFPIAFLRVFLGYFYLNHALLKYNGDFLSRPELVDAMNDVLDQRHIDAWYGFFIQSIAIPHWKAFAAVTVICEFLIGVSFLLGYLVRPMALLGVLLTAFYFSILPQHEILYKLMIATHITMAWLGAGRCLGIDYYFYKRHRGIWW